MQRRRFSAVITAVIAVMFLGFTCTSVYAAPVLEDATDITAKCDIVLSTGGGAGALRDANRNTKTTFTGPVEITITSPEPIWHIYIVWDNPPAPWILHAGDDEINRSEYGSLHEYTPLPGVMDATLELPAGEYLLCDIYVFGEGERPAWVQNWQPPLEKADMLVLPTHADDEHLFFGGTMPTYAGEKGLKVQVAYMTNHWGEPYRPHELLNGLWEAGVTAYPYISNFPDLYASKESLDAAIKTYGYDTVLEFQVELLRRFKPEVVIVHDLNGEYGHGAHKLNAATLVEALELTQDAANFPASYEKYGGWDVPKTYVHLYPENEIVMDWNIPLEHFGGRTALQVAKDAFAKHVSQTKYFEVQDYGPYDCRKFGLIRSTVGPDTGQLDFFENIDLNPVVEPEPESVPEQEPDTSISDVIPASSEVPEATLEANIPVRTILLVVLSGLVVVLLVFVFIISRPRKKR